MAEHQEDFSGGLVTNQDPASLQPNELTQADNAIYLPNDPAIQKAKLRTKYNSVAAGAAGSIKGLRYLEFENGGALLAAHEASSIHLSTFSAETGTFGTLTPVTGMGSGDTLDAVNFNNKYILLNGAGTNQSIRADGTFRRQGMNPVTDLPTQPTIVSGVWNAQLGNGFFHFLTTEVFIDTISGEEIESAFTGTPRTTSSGITSPASQAIQITQPTVVNSNATHWRIYMGPRQDAESPIPNLNEFRLVSPGVGIAIETTTFTVGDTTADLGGKFPGTASSGTWVNPTQIETNNNTGAVNVINNGTLLATNFGFSGLTGSIIGFQILLKLKLTGFSGLSDRPGLRMDLTTDAGVTLYPNNTTRTIPLLDLPGVTGGYVTAIAASPTDLWGRTGSPAWPLTDVNGNTNFGIRFTYITLFDNPFGGLPTIDIDYVKIVVYTTGSAQPVNLEGKPYRVVNVSVAGITTTYPADTPPPVASTGDIFEGQMVLNDIQDLSLIRYSLPEKIESYPSIYFLNFETKTQDVVTCIRRLGNKLMVGLKHQLYRINYLPRETDAEFDRGRSYETISEAEGIVGPQAAALFAPDTETLLLAFISHSGPKVTDGFSSRLLNRDLDWESTVRLPTSSDITDYLKTSVLLDYPAKSQLWFFYTAPGATTNNRAMVFHYSKEHRKDDGTYKATGPITVVGLSAHLGRLAGNDVMVTGQSGGFVYVEDRAYSDASGGNPLFVVKSRESYLAGVGKAATIEKVYTRHRQDATSTVQVTVSARRNDQAQFSATAKTFTTAQAGTSENAIHIGGDSHQIKWEETSNGGFGIRLTGYTLDVKDTGRTEKR